MLNDNFNPLLTNAKPKYLTPNCFAYGIWTFNYVPRIKKYEIKSLFHNEVKNVLHSAGFAKRKLGSGYIYIQKIGCLIKESSAEKMRDYFTRYIDSIDVRAIFKYNKINYIIPKEALKETYLKNDHNIFNDTWLEHLEINEDSILKDTEKQMFFCFQNVIVSVSNNGITTSKYEEMKTLCIWEDQIIPHDYHPVQDYSKSPFYQFLRNITNNNEQRLLTMSTAIGYLLHNYFKESEGQAVVFYDEAITDKSSPMGGTGKGLIVNAIKQVRSVCKIDGKHLDSSNRFRWEQITASTQVAWLDDVKTDFDFSLLHSNLTEGWTIERKHLSQFVLAPAASPKTVICSNSILKGDGTTNIRRRFEVELSDFYSKQIKTGQEKPIEDTHGCIFFSRLGWSADGWNQFFGIMLHCASLYIKHKLVHYEGTSIPMKRLIQATDEQFAEWVTTQGFEVNIRYKTRPNYKAFLEKCGHRPLFDQADFTRFLKPFSRFKGWGRDIGQSDGISYFVFTSM